MKTLLVANWKCNLTSKKEAVKLFEFVKRGAKKTKNNEVVVCPPFVYISILARLSSGNVLLGGQNVFYQEGAFTGEISPLMLKQFGVEYVITGHSERRIYFQETDETINKKIKAALASRLKPILCVGERSGEERRAVLEQQIKEGLLGVKRALVKNVTIAYEPVWAIGTGNNCSIDETLQSALLVRKTVAGLYSRTVAETIRVLYGGSVNSENAASYVKEGGVNGLLVGGASLNAKEFVNIIKKIS